MNGIVVNGYLVGARSDCPSTMKDAEFFAPESRLSTMLRQLVWAPLQIRNYIQATAL